MIFGARLQAVHEIVDEVFQKLYPADRVCSFYYRSHRYIGSKDRQAIGDMVFDIFRKWGLLQWALDQNLTPRLGTFLYILRYFPMNIDSLTDELARASKYTAPLSTEEKIILEKTLTKMSQTNQPSWALYGYPQWIEDPLQESLGPLFEDEVKQFQASAPMVLRVNTLKSDRAKILPIVQNECEGSMPTSQSPWGIVCPHRWRIDQHPLYKEGKIEVQDESSQLCAIAVDVKPGERVLDFCAGAGGKTLALSAMMNNKGTVVAMDVDTRKLQENQKRCRRNGVHNVHYRPLDSEGKKWLSKQEGKFDRILIDVPCSGSGTWRRNPDAKWKITNQNLENLLTIQSEICEQVHKLVKPGGYLIYSTCSLLKSENLDQINNFIKKHPEFSLEHISSVDEKFLSSEGCLRTYVSQHNMDGFFAAKLRLISKTEQK